MRHEVYAEFSSLVTKHGETRASEDRRRSVTKVFLKPSFLRRDQSTASENSSICKTDSCSERGLVETGSHTTDMSTSPIIPTQLWSGILATTDTVIVETSNLNSTMEMRNMGPQVTATAVTQVKEPKSYVDVLYAQAKASQVPRPLP